MAIAHINGLDIYYRSSGAGEMVVMTHGAWTNADTWQGITPLLTDRYRVVAWDRRGHSRSEEGTGRGGYREDAADLVALIEQLADQPVHLVGNSSGGAIVLNAVADRPDLVKTAAVHEPAAFALLEGIDDALLQAERLGEERVRQLVEAGHHREAARYFVDEMGVGLPSWDSLPREVRDTLIENAPTVIDDIEEPYRMESVHWAALARSDAPLLVSYGSDSSELLRESTRQIPRHVRCDLREMRGSGHVPHRTHPEDYAALLAELFSPAMSPL